MQDRMWCHMQDQMYHVLNDLEYVVNRDNGEITDDDGIVIGTIDYYTEFGKDYVRDFDTI